MLMMLGRLFQSCAPCCCHDEPISECLYGETDAPKRWGISPDSCSPKIHLWCHWL